MASNLYVVTVEDETGASYNYLFQAEIFHDAVAEKMAADMDRKFVEVVPAEDFVGNDTFELCTF
jgi:hypothetical protein